VAREIDAVQDEAPTTSMVMHAFVPNIGGYFRQRVSSADARAPGPDAEAHTIQQCG
jgi:hypothetical protein